MQGELLDFRFVFVPVQQDVFSAKSFFFLQVLEEFVGGNGSYLAGDEFFVYQG